VWTEGREGDSDKVVATHCGGLLLEERFELLATPEHVDCVVEVETLRGEGLERRRKGLENERLERL